MKETTKLINDTYDHLTYFDLYGNSIFIFILITFFVFLVFSYCKIMQSKEAVADDWINQRCKPQNMLFAGLVKPQEGKTAFETTNENFQFCLQSILTNTAGFATEPLQYMVQALTQVFSTFADSIQQTREIVNNTRNNIRTFAEDVLNRILNVMIPIQKMFIALMDTFQKIQGTMTASLYTMLGSYYTLQSLMGAILEMIVKILVALVVVIVGLWAVPVSWPMAASMSAVFASIAVPLSVIIYFMSEVMHIKTSAIPKLRCFDENTVVPLSNGHSKYIKDIRLGDSLLSSGKVTALIKVTAENLDMYCLNGILVSESHVVKYGEKWISVRDHPQATKIQGYDKPYLYCLNTSSKQIVLNGTVFTDWDEVYDETLDILFGELCSRGKQPKPENISKVLDSGFRARTRVEMKEKNKGAMGTNNKETMGTNRTKEISQIKIGDVLSTGGIVYGVVYLGTNAEDKLFHLLVSNQKIQINGEIYLDYNNNIDSVVLPSFSSS